MTKIYKWLIKPLLVVILVLFGTLLTATIALQVPTIQYLVVKGVIKLVEYKTDHRITIKSVALNWFDTGTFTDVVLYDFKDQPMIVAGELRVDFDLANLYLDRTITFDNINIDTANLKLEKYSDSVALNMSVFLQRLGGDKGKKPIFIKSDRLTINSLEVSYNHKQRLPREAPLFDHNHFRFTSSYFRSRNLDIRSGEIKLQLMEYQGHEMLSGLSIDSFVSDVVFTQTSLSLLNTKIRTPYSTIGDSLVFSYNHPSNLSYFTDSVYLNCRLRDVKIGHQDLRHFTTLTGWKEDTYISTDVKGTVSRLTLDNTNARLTYGSYINGRLSFSGLPDVKNTFIELTANNAFLSRRRASMLFRNELKIGEINFSGSMIGFVNDFVAKGDFATRAGRVYSDLNLKLGENPDKARYSGKLILKEFDLGALNISKNIGGVVDFNGQIRGIGLTKQSARFNLDARIENLEINRYSISYISTKGDFRANFFSGNVEVADPRIYVVGDARIDFSLPTEVIELDLRVDSLNMYAFKLSNRPLILSFNVDAALKELKVNDTEGTIILNDVFAYQGGNIRDFGSFRLSAEQGEQKIYRIESPEMLASLEGDFELTQLISEIPISFHEYRDLLTKDNKEVLSYYDEKRERPEMDADFYFEGKNINRYMQALGWLPRFSSDLMVEASFNQRKDAYFTAYMEADTFLLGNRSFYQNVVEIDASKDLDSLGVLALIQLRSEEQDWDVVSSTTGLSLESVWNNNQISSQFNLAQPDNQSEAKVSADIKLASDSIQVKLFSTVLKAFDQSWKISQGNQITVVNNVIYMNDLQIANLDQSIALNGTIADSTETKIKVDFENFQMRNVSAILPKDFDGILNGNVNFTRDSIAGPWLFESNARIGNLRFENIPVGNLSGRSFWDPRKQGIYIDYQIERENIRTIRLAGFFEPKKRNALDLVAKFDRASLDVIEPFFSNIISKVSGYANGEVLIGGNLDTPILSGKATLDQGRLTINYLNTSYDFAGNTNFSANTLSFQNVRLQDRFGNEAFINGEMNHNNFRNFEANVYIDHENFELLNTSRGQNKIYYGNAFSTGRIELIGPINNILIRGNVTTAPNTRIYIPLMDDSDIATQSYITFFSSSDSTDLIQLEEDVELKGITMDFNVNVTEDAYSELIFDPRTGDIIRGRATGDLQFNIDLEGKFELFGNLQVKEGAYNFTTSLINKEFEIVPGGSIRWYGDPYRGELNLEANYRQIADPSDWNPSQTQALSSTDQTATTDQSTSQNAPVLVILVLTGPMMNPNIDFRLELDPEVSPLISNQSVWRELLATINNNEAELKRQVFSLLILRKFTQENSFVVGNNNVLGGSVSEFVSNQLSYWLNQVDDNLEISIDLGTLDQDALNTFQLRLAYTFLDGRLRVTRDGAMTFVVDETNNSVANNIIGDWSVEYLLTEDGKLRIRLFTRTDQTITTQNDFNPQPGISFQYVQSFDQLKEFFGYSQEKKEKEQTTSQTPISPDASNLQR